MRRIRWVVESSQNTDINSLQKRHQILKMVAGTFLGLEAEFLIVEDLDTDVGNLGIIESAFVRDNFL